MLRLRVTGLMKGMTPYELSKRSGKRISMSTAYRLANEESNLQSFSAPMLEALLDIFGLPMEKLFERVPEQAPKPAKKRGKR